MDTILLRNGDVAFVTGKVRGNDGVYLVSCMVPDGCGNVRHAEYQAVRTSDHEKVRTGNEWKQV